MKTRIGYVERLTDKLKGYKGVIFEDTPDTVHIECPPDWCTTDTIDGVAYAPFPRRHDKYKDLPHPRPDLEIGDTVITMGGREGVITQITLGRNDKTAWYVCLDNTSHRYAASDVKKVEPEIAEIDTSDTLDFPRRVYVHEPLHVTTEGKLATEAPQNTTVTIKAEDLAELELLSRTLSEAITDVLDKERELRNAKETLSKFMEELNHE